MKSAALSALFLLFPALAAAQSFEASVSGGASVIPNKDLGSGYSLDSGFRLALRATINTTDHLGYEFGYGHNRASLGQEGSSSQGMAVHQGFGEVLLYATPQSARIRPFVAGGGHFSNFVPPGATATYGQGENKFGINYGGGIKVKVTGPWQVRFDFRQFNTGKPFGLGGTGRMLQNEISAGISYTM